MRSRHTARSDNEPGDWAPFDGLIRIFRRMTFLGMAVIAIGILIGLLIGGSSGITFLGFTCGVGALMCAGGVRETRKIRRDAIRLRAEGKMPLDP